VLPALAVAVPLIVATGLAATQSVARRRVGDAVALAATVAVTVFCGLLLVRTGGGDVVTWFGGWRPSHGVALGIAFVVDPLGAGLATFVGLLTLAALVFSWRHFPSVGHVFYALLLVFLAAMVGFTLSGDLFNMFVFFELMTVAAIALTGYRNDVAAPLEGSLNFAITNVVGGALLLSGIGLVYGRAGALNLAQIGASLAHGRADGLVVVAFGLIVVGFLVKAAVVPFHFWLADAYASAPTPVCILFAGVLSELGLYGIARVYWTAFHAPLGHHEAELRAILVGLGALSAVVGALMCFAQRHLKRMLAFATVSYMGLFLIGIGLLSVDGLAGTALYVVGDGLVKASLFVCVGILQHRRPEVEEGPLRGRGHALPWTGAVFGVGALAIAALPPFGSFFGKSLIEEAALGAGYGWVPAIFTLASILTGGTILRVAGRVFLGWGPEVEEQFTSGSDDDAEAETDEPHDRTPPVLFAPALLLLVAALAAGLVPGLVQAAQRAAGRFLDTAAYGAVVLGGHAGAPARVRLSSGVTAPDLFYAAAAVLGACALAGAALFGHRLPRRPPRALHSGARAAAWRLRRLHSGHAGDYVAWLTAGAAVVIGLFGLTLR